MIHVFGKAYGWSKKQVNEVYPKEAVILLKLLANDKHEEFLADRIKYYLSRIDDINIEYSVHPEHVREEYRSAVEKLQNRKVVAVQEYNPEDELPDLDKISELKSYLASHSKR